MYLQFSYYRFSFNLCVDSCPCPDEVAFHMKTMFPENKVVYNHKTQTWNEEIVNANTWCKGPGMFYRNECLINDSHLNKYLCYS